MCIQSRTRAVGADSRAHRNNNGRGRGRRGRVAAVTAAAALLAAVLAGCGAAGPAGGAGGSHAGGSSGQSGGSTAGSAFEMVLDEPVRAESEYSKKPYFELRWSAHPEASSYELAFYAEGEDSYGRGPFAIRTTKGVYSGGTTAGVYFLQGVHTDTVRYRVKVRPSIGVEAWTDPSEYIWSNIWEIDFVDGECTVKETTEDFDEEIAAAEAEAGAEEGSAPEPTPAPKAKDPLPHAFPEPLLTYLARERGEEEPLSAEDIATLQVQVTHDEYGEPGQVIRDPRAIRQFADAVADIAVTGKADDIYSTSGGEGYSATDADGNTLFSFFIQEGLLVGRDGRYYAEGLGGLRSVEGVRHAEDWDEYWDVLEEKSDEYEDGLEVRGLSLLDVSFAMHQAHEAGKENLVAANAYIDWNREAGVLATGAPDETGALFDALARATVGARASSADGQMWHLTLDYSSDEVYAYNHAYLEFRGRCVEIGDYLYEVEGLDGILDSVDCAIFAYLRDFAEAPRIEPSY